ncbi:unnamed protein product [Peniophora sp. CBMAI 1063]|nr:unnamed protein product [Peniophora sp. CBMAI 1063]
MSQSHLFQPIQLGRTTLQHRVVMPALTRNRVDKVTRAVGDDVAEHYALRAAVPGTLLITEATFITPKDAAIEAWKHTPGVWSPEQTAGWKKVVDAVHARGSFIYLQIWAIGREANPDILAEVDPTFPYISASGVPVEGHSKAPRTLTHEEIKKYVQLHVRAARAAIDEAGFDGVELDFAGGYLVDEFLKEFTNKRTDEYGGSPENRARFALEILGAVSHGIGADRVGVKLTPWDTTRAKGYENDNPIPTFTYFVSEARRLHPELAYLHVSEPRLGALFGRTAKSTESNGFIREIWRGKPYISNGGYERDEAIKQADANENELIAFGRHYTSNPDLPIRLQYNIPLTPYDYKTFYAELDPAGYNTFRFAEESKKILIERGVSVDNL